MWFFMAAKRRVVVGCISTCKVCGVCLGRGICLSKLSGDPKAREKIPFQYFSSHFDEVPAEDVFACLRGVDDEGERGIKKVQGVD